MNKVFLIGNVVRDPRISHSRENLCIANFTVACTNYGNSDKANFPEVVAFGKTALNIEKYVKKGMKLCVDGYVNTGSYQNKDGHKVYTTNIVANAIEFVGGEKKNGHFDGNAGETYENVSNNTDQDSFMDIPATAGDDELPFN